jgi:hypothetical protein
MLVCAIREAISPPPGTPYFTARFTFTLQRSTLRPATAILPSLKSEFAKLRKTVRHNPLPAQHLTLAWERASQGACPLYPQSLLFAFCLLPFLFAARSVFTSLLAWLPTQYCATWHLNA